MTESVVAESTPEVVPEVVVAPSPDLEKARTEERNRFTREESLRRDLEDAKNKLSSIKKNGWDLDVISTKARNDDKPVETDLKRELQELKEEIAREKNQRSEIDELQSILDFTRKSDKYELISNLDDAPKFVQQAIREHYKNTGKHISYEEACDFVEGEIEKAESDRFSKFSKTQKAKKIYKLQSVEAKADSPTPTSKTPPKVSEKQQDPTEPKNLHRSNSKEAFNFFRKKYGL